MSINKLFKNYVCELFEQRLNANLELYAGGKYAAGERTVLTTKCVGEAFLRKEKKNLLNIHLKNMVYLTIWTGKRMPLLTLTASKGLNCPCPKWI